MKTIDKLLALILATAIFSLSLESNGAPPPPKRFTFVLVHGAWHGSWAWYRIETNLIDSGHRVINVNLPGHGIDKTDTKTITMDTYCQAVIDSIETTKRKVILIGHSMGGAVISQVAERIPNKIRKLIYVAGFLLQDGESVFGASSNDPGSLVAPLQPDTINKVLPIATKPREVRSVFYGGSKKFDIRLSSSLLKPNPLLPLQEALELTDERYGKIPRFYIKTTRDKAISLSMQESMIAAMPCQWSDTIHAAHSPFFSRPRKLTRMLLRIARDRYPKPTTATIKEEVNITVNQNTIELKNIPKNWQNYNSSIYDLNGKLLHQTLEQTGNTTINTSTIEEISIVLKVCNNNGTVIQKELTLMK